MFLILTCCMATFVGLILIFTGGSKSAAVSKSEESDFQRFGIPLLTQNGVAVVRIEGVIAFRSSGNGLGGKPKGAERVVRLLRKLRKHKNVKAVVLRINSPGGTVAASQEIHKQVQALVAEKKPVVISMGDVCASGGYYIACPASYVMADQGTITGSIGVIASTMNYEGLLKTLKVKWIVYKSGPLKDMGAGYRPSTAEEKKAFASIVMGAYGQFVKAVSEGRIIKEKQESGRKPVLKTEAEVRKIADGRILLGEQALKAGLIDGLGGFYDAIAKAGELAGLGREPHIIRTGSRYPMEQFMELLEQSPSSKVWEAIGIPAPSVSPLWYLYRP